MTPRQHVHSLVDSVFDMDTEHQRMAERILALEAEVSQLRARRETAASPVEPQAASAKPNAPVPEGCACGGEGTCPACKATALLDERDDALALSKAWRKRMKQLARSFGEAGAAHSLRAEKEAADAMLRARDLLQEVIQQVTVEHQHVRLDAAREKPRSAWEHEPNECCVEAVRKDRVGVVKFIQANAEQVGKAYGPNGAHLQSLLDQLAKALAPKGGA